MADHPLHSPHSRASRTWLWVSLAVIIAALLAWWLWPVSKPAAGAQSPGGQGSLSQPPGRPRGGPPGFGGFSTDPTPVRVAAATQSDFPVYLKALGTVTAMNTVNVRGRVDGELVKLLFEEGQKVKAGDLLAVIDPRAYQVALQQAEGAQMENQAQLKNAELDLKRYKGLFEEDSIARQTLDTQEALVNQYRGTLKGNQASVAQAKLNLDFTQVRAPISGRLGLRQVDAGNLVTAGDATPLVVITQTQPISIVFTLPERDLPGVLRQYRAGEPLQVEAWDRGDTRREAEGVLHSVDNQIDVTTGTLKLKARFGNEQEALFPNQFLNVRLRADTLKDAVQIPSAAVQFGTNGSFVYVMDGDTKVSIRQVQVGPSDNERSVITTGLKAGDRVVLEGTDRLREGALVEVVHDENAVPAAPSQQLQGSDSAAAPTDATKPDAAPGAAPASAPIKAKAGV